MRQQYRVSPKGLGVFLMSTVLISATPPPASDTLKAPAVASPADAVNAEISQTPFHSEQMAKDTLARMTVPVSINGSETFPFIVDTGTERTVISKELGLQLGLTSGPKLKLATVSGRYTADSYRLDQLKMNSILMNGIEAPALGQENMGAPGLLGVDVLGQHKVRLDFAARTMSILPAAKKKNRTGQSPRGVIVVLAKKRGGRLVITEARLNGMRIDIVIDTGAQNSIGNLALRKQLSRSQRSAGYTPIALKSVTGETIEGDYTLVREIKFGNFKINGLPVTFTEQHAFKTLNLKKRPAMLLGMDALRLFDSVEIDFVNRLVAFDLPSQSQRQSSDRLAFGAPPKR